MHPSPTARDGHLPSNTVVLTGLHADLGPYRATRDVWCRQCGFVCNLDRDVRGLDEFAGETITSGNTLTNGSFETWSGGNPASWTVSGTVTQVTTSGYFDDSDNGTSGLSLTYAGSTISLSQSPSTPSNFNGDFVVLRARVKSTVNGVVRLRLDINGTSYYSEYNVAQQAFQEMAVRVQAPAAVSSITALVLADNASGTAYVDQVFLTRNGNPTTASVTAGCPHCGSFNYY